MSISVDASGSGALASSSDPILVIDGLTKTFGSNRALDDVSLTMAPGEITSLVGANGSGKSTLIKILSGYYLPDEGGTVRVCGQEMSFGDPALSYRLGCRFVHQDLGLIESLSILDNLSIGPGYPTRFNTIMERAALRRASRALERVGLDIDPRKAVGNLPAAHRTGVAIARALEESDDSAARLLVLDEPTASLSAPEVERLFGIMRASAKAGVAVMFVTHIIEEVFAAGDHVTVLRDGSVRLSEKTSHVSKEQVVQSLVGGSVEPVRRHAAGGRGTSETVLTVVDLDYEADRTVSVYVKAGEIVGLAGLTGSGRESVLRAIFGLNASRRGDVTVEGRRVRPGDTADAMRAGIAYVPSDRHAAAMDMSARENFTISRLRPYWKHGRLSQRQERVEAQGWFRQLDVRPPEPEMAFTSFSGGNQQKILFGRGLRLEPKVLLLDEPTVGVDVGARVEIHRRILEVASSGRAVLLASVDVDELASLCDRVLVMRHGSVSAELVESQVNHDTILKSMFIDGV